MIYYSGYVNYQGLAADLGRVDLDPNPILKKKSVPTLKKPPDPEPCCNAVKLHYPWNTIKKINIFKIRVTIPVQCSAPDFAKDDRCVTGHLEIFVAIHVP